LVILLGAYLCSTNIQWGTKRKFPLSEVSLYTKEILEKEIQGGIRMKGQTYVILSIILVIIVAVFAITNVEAVEVNYLFWSGESPLILIILFSVLMGGVITGTAGAVKVFQLQKENRIMKTENDNMRKTLKDKGLLNKDKHEISRGDLKDKKEK
jgi:uncharacterized integral membrane protein